MGLFKKKGSDKPEPKKETKPKEEHVICPHCFVDHTVQAVQEAGGVCPSCKGKIDLDRIPRAAL